MWISKDKLKDWGCLYNADVIPDEGILLDQVFKLDIHPNSLAQILCHSAQVSAQDLRLLACKWARLILAAEAHKGLRYQDVCLVNAAESYTNGFMTYQELRQVLQWAKMDRQTFGHMAALATAYEDVHLAIRFVVRFYCDTNRRFENDKGLDHKVLLDDMAFMLKPDHGTFDTSVTCMVNLSAIEGPAPQLPQNPVVHYVKPYTGNPEGYAT